MLAASALASRGCFCLEMLQAGGTTSADYGKALAYVHEFVFSASNYLKAAVLK